MSRFYLLNDANWDEELLKKNGLVVMLFWAPWCCHCTSCVPTFEELSEEIGSVTFVTVNKDEGMEIAKKYKVFSLPVMLFLKNGELREYHLGAIEKEKLRDMISTNLSNVT